jgi:hypothetical protein
MALLHPFRNEYVASFTIGQGRRIYILLDAGHKPK